MVSAGDGCRGISDTGTASGASSSSPSVESAYARPPKLDSEMRGEGGGGSADGRSGVVVSTLGCSFLNFSKKGSLTAAGVVGVKGRCDGGDFGRSGIDATTPSVRRPKGDAMTAGGVGVTLVRPSLSGDSSVAESGE